MARTTAIADQSHICSGSDFSHPNCPGSSRRMLAKSQIRSMTPPSSQSMWRDFQRTHAHPTATITRSVTRWVREYGVKVVNMIAGNAIVSILRRRGGTGSGHPCPLAP
jgi:hypothetical protein